MRKMKRNENGFVIFKSEIRKICEDSERDWRLALGDLGSKSRKEKERQFSSDRNSVQNSEMNKILDQFHLSDDKENVNSKIDGQILKMNKDIQVSKFSAACFV